MEKTVAEEYSSSLADLTVNSKPLINMLTMLAEDYLEHSHIIVRTVEQHLQKVPGDIKLPVLYLIDSIVKNVGKTYVSLFTQNIVSTFCSVFEQVDERTRSQMFKLRQTWNEVFPSKKLYALDARVNSIDPAWPITAPPPGRIHVNPKFLSPGANNPALLNPPTPEISTGSLSSIADSNVREELLKKKKELLELQKRKVELELLQTKAILEEQQKKLENQTASLKPETLHQTSTSRTKVTSHKVTQEPSVPKVRSNEVKPEKSRFEGTRRRDPRLKKENDPRLRRENSQKPLTHIEQENANATNKSVPSHSSVHKEEVKVVPPDHSKKSGEKSSSSSSDNKSSSSSRHQKKRREKYKPHKEHKPRMQVLFGDSPDNKESDKKSASNSVSKHIDISIKIGESGVRNATNDVTSRVSSSLSYKRDISEAPSIETNSKDHPKPRKEPKVEKIENLIESKEPLRESENVSQSNVIDTTTFDINEVIPYRPDTEPTPMEIDEKINDAHVQETHTPMEISVIKIDETPVLQTVKENEPPIFIGGKHPSDVPVNACGDTDLRLLPPQNKTDNDQPPEKKSKADMHKLFGEEDVDLRKSLVPPPPPPPIISKSDLELTEGWANIKRSNPEKINSGKSPKKRKSLVCSPRSSIFKKKEPEEITVQDTMDNDVEDRNHSLYIIMKEAEEQLKNETITYAQYNQMLKGVMSMNEESKLQEAIMKDELERVDSPESLSNSSVDVQHHFDKYVPSPPAESSDSYRSHSTACDGKSVTDDNLSELSKTSNDTTENSEKDHGPDGSRRRSRFKNHDQFHRSKSSRNNRYFNQSEPPFFSESNKPWMARHQAPAFPHRPRKEPGYRWSFQHHRQKTADYPVLAPSNRMRAPRHHPEISLPPADPAVLELINNDPMTYVTVGSSTKEVRFYGENAIIMLDWDDPRDLMFQPGSRRVFIDGADVLTLQFNAPYREITLNYGMRIRIRLGAPTRELFIDGRFYDIKFGGPPIEVNLGGQTHRIQLEGPLPFLQIGPTRRTDLVAGKVNLIVDGKIDNIFPIYLDAKPQKFEINSVPFIIRFVEALQTVVINGQPLKIQFGGIPVPIFFRGERHFLRLTSLPPGISPGYVNILNMEGGRLPTPPPPRVPPPPVINDVIPPLVPPAFMSQAKPYEFPNTSQPSFTSAPTDYPQYSVTTTTTTADKPVDVLTSLMPPPVPRFALQNYVVEPYQEAPVTTAVTTPATTGAAPAIPSLGIGTPSIDVIELYQKLVAMGVVSPQVKDKEEPEDKTTIKPVDFSKPETLKVKQPGLISRLYSGIQCSSCGVRFSPEQTVKYSQHLDWHFRQNRRERNSTRIAQSRRWNYDVSDWIQYQEIEDDEDRAQSWFEIQDKRVTGEEEEEALEPTVPAKGFGENPCCTVCRDRFDQFFNEDKEEWQLKRAVCVDDKLYHPVCLKDEQERDGRDVVPVMMPIPEAEDEPIETIDLEEEPVGGGGEEEKTSIETIDIDSSKSPDDSAADLPEKVETDVSKDTPEAEAVSESKAAEEETPQENKENEQMVTEPVDEAEENSDDDILEIAVIKPHIESYDILDDDEEEENLLKSEEEKKSEMNDEKKDSIDENDVEIDEINSNIVIKTEPVDLINPNSMTNTSHINETIYLDGNSEITAPKILLPKKIKINISSVLSKNNDDVANSLSSITEDTESGMSFDYTEPLPPGEEVFSGHLKPRLIGNRLVEMPPISRGKEMSGLCTIM